MKALDDLKKIAENFNNIGSIASTQQKLKQIYDELEPTIKEFDLEPGAQSEYVEKLTEQNNLLRDENKEFKRNIETNSELIGDLNATLSDKKKLQEIIKNL